MSDNQSKMKQDITVLVVEDNWLFSEMLCEVIQALRPDWRIYEAIDGQEGLRFAQTKQPDLIILDFYMPIADGYQLACALKLHPETANIPLILTTSEDATHPQIAPLRSLCQAALYKPFSLLQLERVLEQWAPPATFAAFEPLHGEPFAVLAA
ncbi:MAG: response regulator [Caldilineaceae bacterium]